MRKPWLRSPYPVPLDDGKELSRRSTKDNLRSFNINRTDCLFFRKDFFLQGLGHRLRLGMDVEFFVDVPDVGTNGKEAQIELFGNLLVIIPLYKVLKNLLFPRGEVGVRSRRRHVLL